MRLSEAWQELRLLIRVLAAVWLCRRIAAVAAEEIAS